ncbi:transglycosylase SLT domain-containing protein, partial [Caldovatus sediminis]|uniref:transglycosylase SLT domain-containing protein n=1 Tax=Caldovatus sediminis TaxID=2041189 RepID=UPI001E6443A9
MTMDDFLFQAMAIKLFYAAVGLIVVALFLRWMNWTLGVRFGEMLRGTISRDPLAAAIYFAGRILAVCLFIGMLVGCAAAQAGTIFPDRYDPEIRRAVQRWWPDYPDWVAWKAQLYQESRLRPDAVSPVGAAGLAQFMPRTWADIVRELRLPPGASPHQDVAIHAGAYYMAKLRRGWSTPRPAGTEAVREERIERLVLHRLTGADLRAVAAASEANRTVVAIARSARIPEGKFDAIFDRMDAADLDAAARVLEHFFGP